MNTLGGVIALLSGNQITFTFTDDGLVIYRLLGASLSPLEEWNTGVFLDRSPLLFLLAFTVLAVGYLAWHHDTPQPHNKRHLTKHIPRY